MSKRTTIVALAIAGVASSGCSKGGGAAPAEPIAGALPPEPAVYVQIDIPRFLAQNGQERDLVYSFVPNACLDAARDVRTFTFAWYDGEPGGIALAAEGPSSRALRDCFERGLEWRVEDGDSPGIIRFLRKTYDFAPIPDTEDLEREEAIVLVSPSDAVHLLYFDERLVGRPTPPAAGDRPSVMELFGLVPPATIVAAGVLPPEARSAVVEDLSGKPWASGLRAPSGMALSLQFGPRSAVAVIAMLSDTDADARALENAVRGGMAEARAFVEERVNDPTEVAAWSEAAEILDTVQIRLDGRIVRVEASMRGTGLSSAGLIASALAARVMTSYAMMTAAMPYEEPLPATP